MRHPIGQHSLRGQKAKADCRFGTGSWRRKRKGRLNRPFHCRDSGVGCLVALRTGTEIAETTGEAARAAVELLRTAVELLLRTVEWLREQDLSVLDCSGAAGNSRP